MPKAKAPLKTFRNVTLTKKLMSSLSKRVLSFIEQVFKRKLTGLPNYKSFPCNDNETKLCELLSSKDGTEGIVLGLLCKSLLSGVFTNPITATNNFLGLSKKHYNKPDPWVKVNSNEVDEVTKHLIQIYGVDPTFGTQTTHIRNIAKICLLLRQVYKTFLIKTEVSCTKAKRTASSAQAMQTVSKVVKGMFDYIYVYKLLLMFFIYSGRKNRRNV